MHADWLDGGIMPHHYGSQSFRIDSPRSGNTRRSASSRQQPTTYICTAPNTTTPPPLARLNTTTHTPTMIRPFPSLLPLLRRPASLFLPQSFSATARAPATAPFTTTPPAHLKQLPPRPKHPPESEIEESFLKGSGPGGQKIVIHPSHLHSLLPSPLRHSFHPQPTDVPRGRIKQTQRSKSNTSRQA